MESLKQRAEGLIPCPFCGWEKPTLHDNDPFWVVRCHACGASIGNYRGKEKAEKTWNTRSDTCLREAMERLERYEGALEKISNWEQDDDKYLTIKWLRKIAREVLATQAGKEGV